MAGESDQTRWIGVRPTNPAENIPVTTIKAAPAGGDMQAVEEMIREYVNEAKGASPHLVNLYTVPAGKILILNMAYATASGVLPTSITVNATVNMPPLVNFPIAYWVHAAAFEAHTWFGSLPVDETEIVRFIWVGGAAGGTVIAAMMGYLIDKY